MRKDFDSEIPRFYQLFNADAKIYVIALKLERGGGEGNVKKSAKGS